MSASMYADRRTSDSAVRKTHGEFPGASPYGDLSPVLDQTTGLPLLQLPKGFRYLSYGWTGDRMSDGVPTPNLHDGMAVIADIGHGRGLVGASHLKDAHTRRHLWWWYNTVNDTEHDFDGDESGRCADRCGRLILVRNHEAGLGTPYVNSPKILYRTDGEGGTTNVIFNAEWVTIDDPAAGSESVYRQGRAKGAARFRRIKGAWWGHRTGFFLSADGGRAREGQVFAFDPRRRRLRLIHASPSAAEIQNPDTIVVTPRGGLLMCEDHSVAATNDNAECLLGLTLSGEAFAFAKNNVTLSRSPNGVIRAGHYRHSEWAGACYSPDGRWLFVNIQSPGITFAITGPWHKGPL